MPELNPHVPQSIFKFALHKLTQKGRLADYTNIGFSGYTNIGLDGHTNTGLANYTNTGLAGYTSSGFVGYKKY